MSTPVKTINELLIGTKYEGAENVDFLCADTYLAHSMAGNKMYQDAKTNAALASILPAAVKALENAQATVKHLGHPPLIYVEEALAAISEATKAVEGKR